MSERALYSYHVFLFPFQWYFTGVEMKNKTLEERTCLDRLVNLFKGTKWINKPYKTDTVLNYNEYNYFYDMARKALFDEEKDKDKDKGKDKDKNEALLANLFYEIPADTYRYSFKVCTDGRNNVYKEYSLHIDSIILHLYSTGVGVLSFHLNNRLKHQSGSDDILNINQAGRRLYPPFFAMDSKFVGTQEQFGINDFSAGLDITMKKELAREFRVIADEGTEDFETYRRPEGFASNPFQLPAHLKFLLRGIPLTVDKTETELPETRVFLSPLLDDRMFVICWYGNDEIIKELHANPTDHCKDKVGQLTYLQSDWWYKFMFNDQKDNTCQNQLMMRNLIRKHTYTRWSDYGTFYGVNRYSFVCLTAELPSLRGNNAAFIVNHMQTMYYKLCELCLVQRACILRFSDEVARISAMEDEHVSEQVSNLYKQYLRFVNRVYFREVTAQEQGIELYNMMQEHMQIERNVKDLDQEIEELHSYITLVEDQKQSRNIELLTIIGALFILPTFIISFVGMIIYPPLLAEKQMNLQNPLWLLLPLALGPLIYLFIARRRKSKRSVLVFLYGLVILTLIFSIIYRFTIQCH